MILKKGWALLFSICFCQIILAQTVGPQPKIRHIGVNSGYKYDYQITQIKTDLKGNVWIIGFNGLVRYNGSRFKTIRTTNVARHSLIRLYEENDGLMYAIDYAGQLYFVEADSLRAYAHNDTLKKLNRAHHFYDLYFDQQENLHISFQGQGYMIIDGDGNIKKPIQDNKPNDSFYGFSLMVRENKLPYYSFEPRGKLPKDTPLKISLFDEEMNLISQFPYEKKGAYRYPAAIVNLPNGNYLFSNGRGNLFELNDREIIREIPNDYPIINLFADSKGGIWICTTNSGVHYYKNGILEESNREIILKEKSGYISAEDQEGGLWLYNSDGLNHIPYPRVKYYSSEDDHLIQNVVYGLEVVGDTFYSSMTGNKLSIVNSKTHAADSLVLPVNINNKRPRPILHIRHDSLNDRLWLAMRDSLYYNINDDWIGLNTKAFNRKPGHFRLDIESYDKKYSDYSLIGLCDRQVFTVKDTSINYISKEFPEVLRSGIAVNDSMWIVGISGLYLLANDSIHIIHEQFPEDLQSIIAVTHFNGKLWVNVSYNGIYHFHNDELVPVMVGDMKLSGGGMVRLDSNNLWIFNSQGSFLFTSNSNANDSLNVEVYQPFIQLLSNRHRKANASKLFAATTTNGVLSIDFNDIISDTVKLIPLEFYSLKINKEEVPISDTVYDIAYDKSFIQITYAGISFQNRTVGYRYRLVGLEEEWSETRETYVQYTTLPAGEYHFEIQCRKGNQAWSKSSFLHFEVHPPYWESWWFRSAAILFILMIVYLVMRYRIKVANKEKNLMISQLIAEQKALRAKMDPHFVFNVISSAQYLIFKEEKEKAIGFLQIFSRLLRGILDQSNQSYILLKNEIASLKEYIELEYFRFGEQFEYCIHVDARVNQEEEKIIPFIIQPFVENALLHGLKHKKGRGKLDLDIRLEGEFIKVVVEDDGIGRKAAKKLKTKEKEKQQSHGIKIIKQRLGLHNGGIKKEFIFIEDLKDEDLNPSGTRATIYIKRIIE